jgi:diguanylate cyclase (GGDEF)-like protein/PAS domain S-box-containing protein
VNGATDSHPADELEALIQFLYLAPVGLVQAGMDGEIAFINPVSAQLLMPLSRDGSLTNLFVALQGVAPDLKHLVTSFDQPQGMICDGMRIPVDAGNAVKSDPKMLAVTLLKLDDRRLMAVISDITQQVRRERMLRQSEAWLNAIMTGITDYVIAGLDAGGRVRSASTGLERVTGFPTAAVIGQPFSIFYPEGGTTPDRMLDRLHEAQSSGWSLDDGWRVRQDGSRYWGSALIAPLRDLEEHAAPDEPAFCLIIRDITEKREASESHRRAITCDHLTGLANRRTFYEAAELEIERWRRAPRPLAVILFDADHFKRINDRYGHATGDAVLRHFAALMLESFRQVDIAARVGGEEFAVLLPSTTGEGAAMVATRLRKAVEAHTLMVDGQLIRYTVSGGVAFMDADVLTVDDLLKRADRALYLAKGAGRNRIECWAIS